MCSDSVSVLASEILDFCDKHSLHIACAESLTGGLLSDSFVKIPGASRVFLGSAVTYDIREKSKILGVDCDLLKSCGAVDERVAKQMAFGAARLYSGSGWCYKRFEQQKDVDNPDFPIIGLSTTGVAGPGPDAGKPAGLAYIGVFVPNITDKSCSSLDSEAISCKFNKIKNCVFDCKCGKISNFSLKKCDFYSCDLGLLISAQLNISGNREEVRNGVVYALIKILHSIIFEDWIFDARA